MINVTGVIDGRSHKGEQAPTLCFKNTPENRLAMRVDSLSRCRRKVGHSGPHRSSTREWNDGDQYSKPRFKGERK